MDTMCWMREMPSCFPARCDKTKHCWGILGTLKDPPPRKKKNDGKTIDEAFQQSGIMCWIYSPTRPPTETIIIDPPGCCSPTGWYAEGGWGGGWGRRKREKERKGGEFLSMLLQEKLSTQVWRWIKAMLNKAFIFLKRRIFAFVLSSSFASPPPPLFF